MTEITEEHKRKAHEEAERIRRRVMGQETEEDLRLREANNGKSPGARRPAHFSAEERERRRQAANRYSHAEIIRLYKEGLTSQQIADKIGAKTRKTIVNVLKKHQMWDPRNEGKGGRPFQEYCESGRHLMEKHREEQPPGSGRFQCAPCRREREAEYKRKARAKFKINELRHINANRYDVIIEGNNVGVAAMDPSTAQKLDEKLKKIGRQRGVKVDD